MLVHGYALNHTALAIHRLPPPATALHAFTQQLAQLGFLLNTEGGQVKVSPDGLLLQVERGRGGGGGGGSQGQPAWLSFKWVAG